MDRDRRIRRNFTDSAHRIFSHVAERARDRGMFAGEFTEATAGMLALLSILRWERKVALAALERLGSDLDRLARELDEVIEVEGQATRDLAGRKFEDYPFGQRALVLDTDSPRQPLLDGAVQEARGLGHDYVGAEHLLLASVRLACPRFRELLDRYGVFYYRVRDAVLDVLRPSFRGE